VNKLRQYLITGGGALGLAIAALATSISCTQILGGKAEIRQNRLYLIEAEPIRRYLKDSERPYSAVVELEPFKVSRAYNRKEIVFRRSELEIRFDKHHIWAVRPPDMITDTIEQYFEKASLFTHLGRDFLENRPDYKLSGAIKAIERYDSGDLWFARLAMSMQLVDTADSKVIWRGDFDAERQVYNPGMVYVIQALREILRQQMEKYLNEIDLVLLKMKRQQDGRGLYELPALLDASTQEAPPDTTEPGRPASPDYELIPGKLAP
jgi:ABC-type uncharacterized transport system auxiliary subunit